jgi:hypothetical protein
MAVKAKTVCFRGTKQETRRLKKSIGIFRRVIFVLKTEQTLQTIAL